MTSLQKLNLIHKTLYLLATECLASSNPKQLVNKALHGFEGNIKKLLVSGIVKLRKAYWEIGFESHVTQPNTKPQRINLTTSEINPKYAK